MNKAGFSLKRATGVTKMKNSLARAVGIPLTRSGRERKVGAMVLGLFRFGGKK